MYIFKRIRKTVGFRGRWLLIQLIKLSVSDILNYVELWKVSVHWQEMNEGKNVKLKKR